MNRGVNEVRLMGHLGKNPELSHIDKDNKKISKCTFSLATDNSYVKENGEKVETTEWHRIVLWHKQAEVSAKYLKKGSLVYLEGELRTRNWDENGETRYMTEIHSKRIEFLNTPKE